MAIIKKEDLVNAVRIMELVPERSGTPSSDYLRIIPRKKMLEIAVSSSVTAVLRIPVDESFEQLDKPFFLDKRVLAPFVMEGKDFLANFKVGTRVQDKWSISQGRRHADLGIRADEIEGYIDWREHKGLKEVTLTEGLRKMLLASNTCTTADPALQHLNCVYIGGNLVLATNQAVIFVGATDDKSNLKFAFPLGVIPLLGESLIKGVGVEGGMVILDCGYGFIEGTVSAIAQTEFPKETVLKQIENGEKWPLVAKLPAKKIAKILTRLMNYLGGVKKEDWTLHLDIGGGEVKALVRVKQAEFREVIAIDSAKKVAAVDWPLSLVKPVLDYIAEHGEEIEIRVNEEKKTPYLLSGSGVRMLISRGQ